VTSVPAPATAKPLALIACAVAIVGVAAIWTGVTLVLRGPAGWMAVLAALDAALLLRLAQWPRGNSRAGMAVAVTVATALLANYFVAAAQIGIAMGLRPYEALPLMGPELAMLYAQSNHGVVEWVSYAIAVIAAWVMGR
jgi:hypothetical protein